MNHEPENQISLDFSDPELAELISNGIPFEGMSVSRPQTVIKASASAGLFLTITITFLMGIGTNLISAFIYDCLTKGKKKSGYVNGQEITFSQESIRRIIDKKLSDDKSRDEQWAKEQKKPIRD